MKKEVKLYPSHVMVDIVAMEDSDITELGKAVLSDLKCRGICLDGMDPGVFNAKTFDLVEKVKNIASELKHRGELGKLNGILPAETVQQAVVVQLNDVEMAFAESGRVISAIKELRARVGIGLRDAKDQVDAYVKAWKDAGSPRGGLPKPGY